MEKVGLKSFSLVNLHLQLTKSKTQKSTLHIESILRCPQEQVGLQRGSPLHRRPSYPRFCSPAQHGWLHQKQIFKVILE